MISKYAFQHEDKVDGIIFLGSYPADDFCISDSDVINLWGSRCFSNCRKNRDNKKVYVKEYNYAHDKKWKPCSFWHVW